jgi:hypothetical protein
MPALNPRARLERALIYQGRVEGSLGPNTKKNTNYSIACVFAQQFSPNSPTSEPDEVQWSGARVF